MTRPPRLRIISGSELPASEAMPLERPIRAPVARQKIDATHIPENWQLSLPFDGSPIGPTVLIVPMESMNGLALRGIFSERRPKSAVDLREMIRFDLPGTSREDVFHAMHMHHTFYVKDPLPWHRLDAKAFAKLDAPVSQILVHEIVDRGADCVLVFVYRQGDARLIASHLTKVLSERMRGPYKIEEAH